MTFVGNKTYIKSGKNKVILKCETYDKTTNDLITVHKTHFHSAFQTNSHFGNKIKVNAISTS